MRIGVVHAPDRHLPHGGAEERAGESAGALGVEPVSGRHLFAVDPLEDDHALGHTGRMTSET